jgi:dethiobiotin synthetase
MRIFITGTGTGVGKTWVGRAPAEVLRDAGKRVTAIKPVETGCTGNPGRPPLLTLSALELAGIPCVGVVLTVPEAKTVPEAGAQMRQAKAKPLGLPVPISS